MEGTTLDVQEMATAVQGTPKSASSSKATLLGTKQGWAASRRSPRRHPEGWICLIGKRAPLTAAWARKFICSQHYESCKHGQEQGVSQGPASSVLPGSPSPDACQIQIQMILLREGPPPLIQGRWSFLMRNAQGTHPFWPSSHSPVQ